jgi:hypothetical protein
MSIEQSAERLASFYRKFLAERDLVIKDERWAEHIKKQNIATQFTKGVQGAETALVELWGKIDNTRSQIEGYVLTEDGVVWTEFNGLEKRLSAAREAAGRVDTSEATYGIARIRSLLTMHGNPADFMQRYEHQMSDQEKIWTQDFLAGVLENVRDADWNRALHRLDRHREERMQTPALAAVEVDIAKSVTAALAAHKLSKQVANEFARESWYIGQFLSGIDIVRTQYPSKLGAPETRVSVERQAWAGIRFAGDQFGGRVRTFQGTGGLFGDARAVEGGSME